MAVESRTKKAVRNVKYGMINKLVTLFLSLAGRYIFLCILPLEYLGINGVFADVLSMLSLADLGFATAMAYSLYKPLAQKDEKKIIALISFYRNVYHMIAAGIAVIGLALVPFLKYIITVDHEIPHLTLYYLISLFNTVVSYLFAYKQSLITADQKYYLISKYSMWIAFFKIILQTVILYFSHSYTAYLFVGVITTVAYNLLVNYQANKHYPYICDRSKLDKDEKKSIIENMKSVFIYKISSVLMEGTDNTLISILVSTAAVGLYSNYLTIINKIMQFAWIAFNSVTAGVGNLIAEGDRDKVYAFFKVMRMCSFWIASYTCITLFYLTDGFIDMWLGSQYVTSRVLLFAILCNTFYGIYRQPVGCFREAAGMYKKIRYIMLICAFINIGLSIVMGSQLGTKGVIFASIISNLLTTFWYETKILYRDLFDTSCICYFVEVIRDLFILFATALICGKVLQLIVTPNPVVNWIVKGMVCTVVINLIYLLIFCNTDEFRQIMNKLFKKRSVEVNEAKNAHC
ncbi:MAG: hypothetical protein II193_09125 [Lachnospiraceae bacterium]|nr:hypothetical protein [Lachnospiraceae bacterium]